jgi:hypothetical protein
MYCVFRQKVSNDFYDKWFHTLPLCSPWCAIRLSSVLRIRWLWIYMYISTSHFMLLGRICFGAFFNSWNRYKINKYGTFGKCNWNFVLLNREWTHISTHLCVRTKPAENINITLDVKSFSLVDYRWRFGGTCCYHLLLAWIWRKHVPPKRPKQSTRLNGHINHPRISNLDINL